MFVCLINNQEFSSEKELHSFIRWTLKMKLADYYQKYYPRHDYLTKEPIPFIDKEHYFSTFFLSRTNLVNYFKNHNIDINLIKEIMVARAKLKCFNFAPSSVECRTSILPTPILLKNKGADFNALCKELNLKCRYNYSAQLSLEYDTPLSIIIDTREQKPLEFSSGTAHTVSKLDFGDYVSSSHYKKLFLERKSLVDFCGTMSAGFERFKKEVERAANMNSYIITIIEEPLNHLDNLPEYVKGSSEFFKTRMKDLCQKYENLQFLFVKNRVEMAKIVEKLFRLNNLINEVDVQFYYDSGQFHV